MNILHIGDEMSWRGGENQVRFLIEGSKNEPDIQHFVAYPKGSRGVEIFQKVYPTLVLPSRKPDSPFSIFKLVQYAKENKIDLIDAQSSGGHSLALWLKKFLPHLKLVVHRRVDNPIKTHFLSRRKYLHPSIDKYVAISDCIGNILLKYGVAKDKIETVHSAIDPSIYRSLNPKEEKSKLSRQLGVSDEPVWIGNASAFSAQKGPLFMIESLRKLKENNISFQCLLAGDGALLNQCKKNVMNYGLEDCVHFLGHIKEVPQLLSALDVLLFPSENEGLGTLLLDSISAGTVPVSTRVGGIPEIIKDGKTGFSVEPGDLDSFVTKTTTLINQPALRQKLVQQAQVHIESNFSIDNMVSGNLKIYRQLLKSH